MRIAVTIYLVFATAIGPWPCCCALPGSACRSTAAELTAPNGPPSCCHAGKPRPEASLPPGAAKVVGGERTSGGPTPPSCPCGERGCAAKARTDQARPVKSHSPSPGPAAAGGVIAAFVPTAAPALVGTSAYDWALWCVVDRLNGHRVLRC